MSTQNTFVQSKGNKQYEIHFEGCSYAVIRQVNPTRYKLVRGSSLRTLMQLPSSDLLRFCERCFVNERPCTTENHWYMRRVLSFDPLPRLKSMPPAWLFSPWLMITSCIVAISASFICQSIINLADTNPALLTLWIVFNIIVHESGHVLACMHAGRSVGRCGLKLDYGLPMFFVDTADICMANTKQRIATSLAGPYLNSATLLCLCVAELASGKLYLSLNYLSIAFIVGNLVPFLKLDGYFILCDIISIPNLMTRSKRAFKMALTGQRAESGLLLYYCANLLFILLAMVSIGVTLCDTVFNVTPQ